ncbi:hypothetical protein GGH94_001457 [Coemansia aciculifera]|uniref:Uncharacterized protein n=1 Tax=Coemansia aciculifera TaxID=417176 RepID=A0A9W8M854_9FUNG|nr:hypothetical protein GGH94_001457 [Coemansia aciculifera]
MDSQRSLFQTLPMLVVHKVVEYLEGRSRTSFSLDIDAHNKGKAILTPLLSVSEHWCAVALASICDNCLVGFDYASKGIDVSFPAWPASAPYSTAKLILPSDKAIASLISQCIDQRVDQRIDDFFDQLPMDILGTPTPVSVTSQEKVTDFARSLLRLIPAVVSTIVSVQSINDTELNHGRLYDTLVSELCRGSVKCLQAYSGLNGSLVTFNLLVVSGLTSIAQGSGMACMPLVRLAYQNARTLEELTIGLAEEPDWRTLVYGGTGLPIVFNSLKELTLTVADVPYTSTWAEIEGTESFPVLSTLVVSGGYPFDDDFLFRGNGKTLQNLRIPFKVIARNILGRFNVLKRSGVTRMNSIHIGRVSDVDKAFIASLAEIPVKQQMGHILETATTLSLQNDTVGLAMHFAIKIVPSISVIRHLAFAGLVFDTSHIIDVISALPSLVSLTCDVRGSCSSAGTIPASERPSNLDSKYYPLSRNFRVLRVPYSAQSSAKKIAIVAIQIAILCPNFLYVDIAPEFRNVFSREVAWAGFNRTFEPYTKALQSLIYTDLDD